jgi:hypothetical protein
MVARCGADCAVFAGDDVNDEPVFESAPPHWLTIRIGCAATGRWRRCALLAWTARRDGHAAGVGA